MKMNLPDDFCSDDEALMDTTTNRLSAEANPFYPTSPSCNHHYEPVNIAIFNDGVLAMTVPSEADRCKILHGIEDQAIDEEFPPDARDAAELEDTEAFVLEMTKLSIMEEREERARAGFTHIKKRWEARRKQGASSRPRPPMNLIVPEMRESKHNTVQELVCFPQSRRIHVKEDQLRTHEIKMKKEPRLAKMASPNHLRPIQQPRKST